MRINAMLAMNAFFMREFIVFTNWPLVSRRHCLKCAPTCEITHHANYVACFTEPQHRNIVGCFRSTSFAPTFAAFGWPRDGARDKPTGQAESDPVSGFSITPVYQLPITPDHTAGRPSIPRPFRLYRHNTSHLLPNGEKTRSNRRSHREVILLREAHRGRMGPNSRTLPIILELFLFAQLHVRHGF